MYYSQPLRPPCCNTPAEGKTAVHNNTTVSAMPNVKLPKGKPSIIKEKDNSKKKTVTYRSGALDTYDFSSWTRDAYEQREETVPGKIYSGVIIDRKGNRYTIKGDMEATDSGSRLGGFNYYYQIEIVSTDIVVFSRSSDIIHDLEQGYYLEDYLVKNREYIRFVDDTNVRGKTILASLDNINAIKVKSYEQMLKERQAQAEATKRNSTLDKIKTVFRLSEDEKYWIEQATNFALYRKNCYETLTVLDGFLSHSDLPDKRFLVKSLFGQPVTNFPVRATYSCKNFFSSSEQLCKEYGYADYNFKIGFACGTEDISAITGMPGPIYAVNVYMVNDSIRAYDKPHIIKCGDTNCLPVIEQAFINNCLNIKEFENNMLFGKDTRLILNHPDYDKLHADDKTNYYIFRNELYSVDDLLISKIRPALYRVADSDITDSRTGKPILAHAMVRDALDSLWGYRHSLQYNLKSDVFYFVMDKYMFSLNFNHTDADLQTTDLSEFCYAVNRNVSGIRNALKRVSCKPYKSHTNTVRVSFQSE